MKITICLNKDTVISAVSSEMQNLKEILKTLEISEHDLEADLRELKKSRELTRRAPYGEVRYVSGEWVIIKITLEEEFMTDSFKFAVRIAKLAMPFVNMAKSLFGLITNFVDQVKGEAAHFNKKWDYPSLKECKFTVLKAEYAGQSFYVMFKDDGFNKDLHAWGGLSEPVPTDYVKTWIQVNGGQRWVNRQSYTMTLAEAEEAAKAIVE